MQQIRSALSLFNGISGLHLALDKAQINVEQVYYSEIDKFANKVTEQQYPNDIALGDVTKWKEWDIDWSSVDLVSAGFPCQAWSVAGKQLGDKDERGMLFWTTLDIIKTVLEHNPKAKFLMENVKMKKDFEEYITHHTTEALGYVEKILINSALVSAQNRNRYYWTNFEVTQPEDKGLLLKDILEGIEGDRICERIKEGNFGHIATATDIKGMDCIKRVYGVDGKAPTLTTMGGGHREPKVYMGGAVRGRYNGDGSTSQKLECDNQEKTNSLTTAQKDNVVAFNNETVMKTGKTYCLTANYGGAWAKHSVTKKVRTMVAVGFTQDSGVMTSHNQIKYRKLTPLECERLQTVPDNWTECLSNTQRYKSLGNGWTIDVIVHILECAFK